MLPVLLLGATLACDDGDVPAAPWRVTQVVDGVTALAPAAGGAAWGAAEGMVPAPIGAVLRHLVDFDQMPEMIPWLATARVLERGADEALVYFRYDLPWPVADRDYTARYRWTLLPTGRGRVEIVDADGAGPPVDGAVRVTDLRACFTLEARADDRTRVRYRVHMELGGRLPRRMKDEAVKKLALRSVLGLRRYFSPPLVR